MAVEAQLLHRHELVIASEDDIAIVRRKVKEISAERSFDAFAAAAITTATSELSRNVWVHARGGRAVIEEITDGARLGIRIHFHDLGPGIDDVERVLRGGYSTARSLGLGVSGTRRLVDEFELRSKPGMGTDVTIVKWTRY
jgi:serine/threonine-protein kinase RsbT